MAVCQKTKGHRHIFLVIEKNTNNKNASNSSGRSMIEDERKKFKKKTQKYKYHDMNSMTGNAG